MIWMCEKCYDDICKFNGIQDMEVHTIANVFGMNCEICKGKARYSICLTKINTRLIMKYAINEIEKLRKEIL